MGDNLSELLSEIESSSANYNICITNQNMFTQVLSADNVLSNYSTEDVNNFSSNSNWLYLLFTKGGNGTTFISMTPPGPAYYVLGGSGAVGEAGLSQPQALEYGRQGYGNGGNGGDVINGTLTSSITTAELDINMTINTDPPSIFTGSYITPSGGNQTYAASGTNTSTITIPFQDGTGSFIFGAGSPGQPSPGSSSPSGSPGGPGGTPGGMCNVFNYNNTSPSYFATNMSLLGITVINNSGPSGGNSNTDNINIIGGHGGQGVFSCGGGGGGEGGYFNTASGVTEFGYGGSGAGGGSSFLLIYFPNPYNGSSSTATLVSNKGHVFRATYEDVNGIDSVLTFGDPRFPNKPWFDPSTGDFYQPGGNGGAGDLKSYKVREGASKRFQGLGTRETTVNGKTRLLFEPGAFATHFQELTSPGYFDQTLNTRVQGINPTGLIPYLVEALNEQNNTVEQHKKTLATQQQAIVKQRKRMNKQQNALKQQYQLLAALLGKRR